MLHMLAFTSPFLMIICVLTCTHSGKWLGSRQIRCNWATKGAGSNDDKQSSDAKSVVELTNGSSGELDTRHYIRC